MKKVISIFLSCLLSANFSLMAHDLPKLATNEYGVKQLLLDNQPYVMLAGELMNSSASTLESMALKWQHLKDLNLNTILLAITWEQLEPEEGRYDFAIVDGLIKEARKYDLKLVFLWFGSWKNGTSGYAPYWVMKDTKRFPRMRDEKGQNLPYLANFTSALTNIESKAFYKLMDHIRQIDSEEQTVLMV
ncbi:beta-galactosidase [Bacteroides intestinalis]|uniref:Beta-galactosidase n=1 Tax=Bacteroides intestinalis TaxID=329854 RepID=A0A6N2R1G3_9BACE|nr:beta-galactosidase [Bacteroides intestinalis]